MAYYYSVRGWLEVSPDNFESATSQVRTLQMKHAANHKSDLYMKGWCWNDTPINWSRYIFYGADVTAEGLDLLKSVLRTLADLRLELTGYFHAQGEDSEKNFTFKLTNDVLTAEPTDTFLDIS